MNKEKTASNPRLLILSCSKRKRSAAGLQPALDRYDGPVFRVMKKFIRAHPFEAQAVDVYVLSAKFGLIPEDHPIAYYDRRMTLQRVKRLNQRVLTELKRILIKRRYIELFISVGKDYLQALDGFEPLIPDNLKVITSTGSMGRKQSELRNWLHREPLMLAENQSRVVHRSKVRLRGVEIALTPKQVIDVARSVLDEQRNIPKHQVWYVHVDGQRIPPKWLVSQLTGLPVNSFHTSEAKRVLRQLGLEICSRS